MNNKHKQNYISPKYDTAYINPGIDCVIMAIEKVQKGDKVLLVFETQIERSDKFQLTQTFPFRAVQLFKAAREKKLLNRLSLLAPHLFQPQKVICLRPKTLKTKIKIIDFFLGNQLGERSEIINQPVPENLSFLKFKMLKGFVFHEYKINVSRLFIELLKYFELNGGTILIKKNFNQSGVLSFIQCKKENNRSCLFDVNTPPNFALIKKAGKNRFLFTENNGRLQVGRINQEAKNLLKNQLLKELKELILFDSNSVREFKAHPFITAKTVAALLKVIKKPLPNSFVNTTTDDNYELCLEKFDIAKQTGIAFPDFKILFHRYGAGIDKMIDTAYEKVNKIRDPQKVWEATEKEYWEKYEWQE